MVSRGVDTTLLTKWATGVVNPIAIVESVWPDGTVRIHSNVGSLSWDGHTWLGIGDVAGSAVSEEGGGSVPGEATLTIMGTLETVLGYADPDARGGEVQIWLGDTTEPGGLTLDGTPTRVFIGYLDANRMVHDFESGDASLSVTAAAGPAAREFAAMYHSAEDQKARHPGDTFFERVATASQWRATPIKFPNPG